MSEIKEEYYLKEKYDLEEILNPLYNTKQKYYEWCTKRGIEDYSLIFVIDQIRASCLSPAYNYNRLVDEIIQDLFWDQIKYTISEEQWVSMGRRTEQIIIAVQNCLISIKIGSVVFAFYNKADTEYDSFVNQFNELDDDEKMRIISYIIYEYSEDMLTAKKFPHRTWFLNKMEVTFRETTEIFALSKEMAQEMQREKVKALQNIEKDFPCILSEKFAVKK